jgi:hypothetical protein
LDHQTPEQMAPQPATDSAPIGVLVLYTLAPEFRRAL